MRVCEREQYERKKDVLIIIMMSNEEVECDKYICLYLTIEERDYYDDETTTTRISSDVTDELYEKDDHESDHESNDEVECKF